MYCRSLLLSFLTITIQPIFNMYLYMYCRSILLSFLTITTHVLAALTIIRPVATALTIMPAIPPAVASILAALIFNTLQLYF